MRLYREACGFAVTIELLELMDISGLDNDAYGKDYLPKGFYSFTDKVLPHMDKIEIVVNYHDVVNCIYHWDRSRLNGCCGQDGCDGTNRVCVNGHEVETERSDCWTYHFTSFDPEVVGMVD